MKKYLSLLLCALLVFTSACAAPAEAEPSAAPEETAAPTPEAAATPAPAAFAAGTYTAHGPSIGGEITLNVTFDETSLVSVETVEMSDTRYVYEQAFNAVTDAAIAGQTLNVDLVSGATYSSNAVLVALKNAASQAGALETLSAAPAYASAAAELPQNADVIVVGSGISGLTAALTAQENGANVVIVEKLDVAGGSSMLSEGCFAGSTDPAECEKAIDNLIVASEYLPTERTLDMDKINRTYGALASAHSWLYDCMVDGGLLEQSDVVTSSVRCNLYAPENISESVNTEDDRWNMTITGFWPTTAHSYHGADYVLKTLVNRFLEKGGQLYTDCPAVKLHADAAGSICGVEVEYNGSTAVLNAPAVVLACGGSGRNTDNLIERDRDDETYACIGDTGDALALGGEIGAAAYADQRILTDSGRIYPIDLYNGVAYSQTPFTSIYVDDSGSRRVSEAIWMTLVHASFFQEGRDHYWSIANASVLNDSTLPYGAADIVGKNMLELVESRLETYPDYYVKADTIEELAQKLNMPNLAETMADYNEGCKSGNDAFGKTAPYLVSMEEGPYYAIHATLYGPGTLGSLVSDPECRVLTESGEAIPGLFVAGEASNGGFFTETYMCNHMMGLSLSTGRIAGENAAQYAAN